MENEYAVYQDSLKEYWDLKSAMDTYFGKGKMEGKMEMALEMIQNQEPLEKIIQYTKLSSEIIEEIRKKNQIM